MVLIKPDQDITQWQGFQLADVGAKEAAVTGEVVSVPEVVCNWVKVNQMMKRGGEIRKQRAAWLTRRSSEFPVEPEVRSGDRVFFSYLVRHFSMFEDKLVVPYDLLIAREHDLYPLNGNLLVQVTERKNIEKRGAFYMYNSDVNVYGDGVVVRAGQVLPGYLDHPSRPDTDIKEGARILYDKRYAVRLEVDQFNTTTEGQSSLFRVHRKYVKWIY